MIQCEKWDLKACNRLHSLIAVVCLCGFMFKWFYINVVLCLSGFMRADAELRSRFHNSDLDFRTQITNTNLAVY